MLTRRRDTPIGPETLADDSQKVLMGCAGFSWVVQVSRGLCRFLVGCAGFSWVVQSLVVSEASRAVFQRP
jgi:hypothetical protein